MKFNQNYSPKPRSNFPSLSNENEPPTGHDLQRDRRPPVPAAPAAVQPERLRLAVPARQRAQPEAPLRRPLHQRRARAREVPRLPPGVQPEEQVQPRAGEVLLRLHGETEVLRGLLQVC